MANVSDGEPGKSPPEEDPIMDDLLEPSETKPDIHVPTNDEIQKRLYDYCKSRPPDTVFSQEELLATDLIPERSIHTLQIVTSALTKNGRFRLMQQPKGAACWRCNSASVPLALSDVDPDARLNAELVYSYVESSGRDGLWTGHLSRKCKLKKAPMDKALKLLEQRRYIKTASNHRHPGRKTYMLYSLQPAEDLSGGPFFSDGELDEEFVRQISFWIEKWIIGRSWWFPPEQVRGKKRKHADGLQKSEKPGSKEQAEALRDIELNRPPPTIDGGRFREKQMRPFPPSFKSYPTIAEITNAVNKSKISKTTMKQSDTQTLVDILVWDGKLEKLKKRNSEDVIKHLYKAVRNPFANQDGPDTGAITKGVGLTEAPCGRCPVFDICEDGGLVSAKSCPYFQTWLEI